MVLDPLPARVGLFTYPYSQLTRVEQDVSPHLAFPTQVKGGLCRQGRLAEAELAQEVRCQELSPTSWPLVLRLLLCHPEELLLTEARLLLQSAMQLWVERHLSIVMGRPGWGLHKPHGASLSPISERKGKSKA